MILDELVQEINELKECKKKYEHLLVDYNKVIERLHKFEFVKWENARPQDRQKYFKENYITGCKCCRWFSDVKGERCRISSNILKPELKEHDDGKKYIGYQCCKDFEWD